MIYKNNPFNIRYSQGNIWLGEESPRNGFCTFQSLEYGIRAYLIVIRSYLVKHHISSVQGIINRFAPACENHSEFYIEYVCKSYLESTTIIDSIDKVVVLAQRMAYFESNYKLSEVELLDVISHFHIFDQTFK